MQAHGAPGQEGPTARLVGWAGLPDPVGPNTVQLVTESVQKAEETHHVPATHGGLGKPLCL